MASAMTSSPAAARACKLAGERRRDGTNGGHQHVESDAANSPVTKTAAEDQRTATANDGGADEDGDATATTTAAFPSDGDDWSDGDARLERRRQRRCEATRC
uniref:Uncharacterized protein n=1 Tax=Oryza sativa subsp. japonica TaxID=39947 RepID=Q8S759_ORYSJ|nr:unknown protein [Oryza sativa Japonica Group]